MSKKIYSKPEILFEDFSLSTNIAASCEEKPYNNTVDCGIKWSKGTILFNNSITGCTLKIVDGDPKYNKLCYHNPTDMYNVQFS